MKRLLTILALLGAVTASATTTTVTSTCSYPTTLRDDNDLYFYTTTTTLFTAQVSGMGPAGGAAMAFAVGGSGSGGNYAAINLGAGPGTPFNGTNAGYAPSGMTVVMYTAISTNGPGGYGTAKVTATW